MVCNSQVLKLFGAFAKKVTTECVMLWMATAASANLLVTFWVFALPNWLFLIETTIHALSYHDARPAYGDLRFKSFKASCRHDMALVHAQNQSSKMSNAT